MVIKSLDHWPDLGSDLDLFTSAPSADVIQVMKTLSAHRWQRAVGETGWRINGISSSLA